MISKTFAILAIQICGVQSQFTVMGKDDVRVHLSTVHTVLYITDLCVCMYVCLLLITQTGYITYKCPMSACVRVS